MAKIRFECTECGKESWFDINEKIYIVHAFDLICDDCNFEEEEN